MTNTTNDLNNCLRPIKELRLIYGGGPRCKLLTLHISSIPCLFVPRPRVIENLSKIKLTTKNTPF